MTTSVQQTDVLIIGAGIIGLTLAREFCRIGKTQILVIDEEPEPGRHASGRNSGVIHSGIYYPPNSLKAKLSVSGNQALKSFCAKHHIPVAEIGKVLVCRDIQDLEVLKMLEKRGQENGVKTQWISATELAKIEPLGTTYEAAMQIPSTAVVDPKAVLAALRSELEAQGVQLTWNTRVTKIDPDQNAVQLSTGDRVSYSHLVNASGTDAVRLAHQTGAGLPYRLLPFKGCYKKLDPAYATQINHLIYPVPDLNLPFLGVHVTKSIQGDVYLGPTAMPAFGPKQYRWTQDWGLSSLDIAIKNAVLMVRNPSFRRSAIKETKLYWPAHFFKSEVQHLLPSVPREAVFPSQKVGIRPQLINWESKALVMDFVIETQPHITHILNAISPAFTASMAFSKWIVETQLQ